MRYSTKSLLQSVTPKRVIWPILIGLGVASFLIYRDFDSSAFQMLSFNNSVYIYLLLAIIMVAMRDVGYMYRIRLLCDKQLSWRKSFDVIMLWEFASSITPSIIGGTAFAFFILIKEKISAGKATAIVLVTALLDELFFIIFTPLCILLIGIEGIFPALSAEQSNYLFSGNSVIFLFFLGYAILFIYTVFLVYGIFINPNGLKWLIVKIFSLPFLRKWKAQGLEAGKEVIIASQELKGRNYQFWTKAFVATMVSWTARYMVINFLILAFANPSFADHIFIYGRQFVMWVIMLIPVTPGGSGVAEIIFPIFLKEFIPYGLADALALLWRLLSYYPYLLIGVVLLPRWVRRVYRKDTKKGISIK